MATKAKKTDKGKAAKTTATKPKAAKKSTAKAKKTPKSKTVKIDKSKTVKTATNGDGKAVAQPVAKSIFPTIPTFRSLVDSFWNQDNFFGRDFSMDEFFHRAWTPAVNIKDNTKTYEIKVAVPGLNKEDFKIIAENGLLCIKGEREDSTESKEDNFTRREYSYNQFERTFTLPENAKADTIKAKYENGELKITMAKTTAKKRVAKAVKIA